MDIIREWAFALCAFSLCTGILAMIIPTSEINKLMKLVVSVFFLIIVISPIQSFAQGEYEIGDFFNVSDEELQEESIEIAQNILKSQVAESLAPVIKDKLDEMGIQEGDFQIVPTADENLNIEEISLILMLDSVHESEGETIKAVFEGEYVTRVTIIYR